MMNKISKEHKSMNSKTPESFDIHSGNLSFKVISGKLIEQNVESILYV